MIEEGLKFVEIEEYQRKARGEWLKFGCKWFVI